MPITRRDTLTAAMAAIATGAFLTPAHALTAADAKSWVRDTVQELRGFLGSSIPADQRAAALRQIMESRSNLPLIARYCAGRSWRDMTDPQRERYVEAFKTYISATYARRFGEYKDNTSIDLGRTIDAGKKGMLVESPITLPDGRSIAVEWLVSDRSGRLEIIDIVIEGISLAATQREEIGAIVEKRGGDIDALIAHLESAN